MNALESIYKEAETRAGMSRETVQRIVRENFQDGEPSPRLMEFLRASDVPEDYPGEFYNYIKGMYKLIVNEPS